MHNLLHCCRKPHPHACRAHITNQAQTRCLRFAACCCVFHGNTRPCCSIPPASNCPLPGSNLGATRASATHVAAESSACIVFTCKRRSCSTVCQCQPPHRLPSPGPSLVFMTAGLEEPLEKSHHASRPAEALQLDDDLVAAQEGRRGGLVVARQPVACSARKIQHAANSTTWQARCSLLLVLVSVLHVA